MLKNFTSSQKAIDYVISSSDYRQYTRYTNNLGTVVEIDYQPKKQVFINSIKGLIINDSLGGCGLIVATNKEFQANQICWLRTYGLRPIKVRIAWVQEIENNIFRLGIEYLDSLDSNLGNLG
ncbi:PilZ domain-containing protein [Gloeothece verrucosa]|uniref:PilZ domain-containing protein n=1 Tax=Gloeothece verrucosa (strain PCC 7822) TaxID=497965 RepID=E0UBN9_GLOV7|nr:PilZ domain-containing protein [Gloeothece verrucosa]ADN13983.1 hypothetical protein Cyan7822_2001 [Gloeothece verrucosa PCC 7822]